MRESTRSYKIILYYTPVCVCTASGYVHGSRILSIFSNLFLSVTCALQDLWLNSEVFHQLPPKCTCLPLPLAIGTPADNMSSLLKRFTYGSLSRAVAPAPASWFKAFSRFFSFLLLSLPLQLSLLLVLGLVNNVPEEKVDEVLSILSLKLLTKKPTIWHTSGTTATRRRWSTSGCWLNFKTNIISVSNNGGSRREGFSGGFRNGFEVNSHDIIIWE